MPTTSAASTETGGTLHFAANAWTPSVEGQITRGGVLGIDFAASRLPKCRQLDSNTAWEIDMHYRFDNGPIASIIVADPGNDLLVTNRIAIPSTVSTLTVWFENIARSNGGTDIVCQTSDSDYGQNYGFAIE